MTRHLSRACLLVSASGILCMFLLGGCRSRNAESSLANKDELDAAFQAGADRPPTARTLHSLARILAAQRRDQECAAVLGRIIHEYPEFLPAYADLAELEIRNDRISRAIQVLLSGLRKQPTDAVLLNNLGMCYFFQRDYSKALLMFTRAVASMPEDARYRANMAMVLGMMGRYEESLSLYRQVLPEEDARENLTIVSRLAPGAQTGTAPKGRSADSRQGEISGDN